MAETPGIRVAILIVSDTAAADPSTDRSSEALRTVFAQDGGSRWDVVESRIVPDQTLEIQRSITQWTDGPDPMALILTTGGTGFAVRDNTPEVGLIITVKVHG